ncbi:transcriptional regulator [Seongchinamella sediminis]|uniref:Transcriptional regulator n=1 Tax=Seongchinamella sediminis TaxID=2283635 RepID=A0A3L7DU67_9GAMM|nr:helix-turn-helix domain-containing protein [Seongchinamella sediminis]RLQ21137.1 transcriptional regulator [Seongchinamella sediminis]
MGQAQWWELTVGSALNVIGDKWTCLVLGGAFQRCQRFEDWQRLLGISRSILSKRLQWLVDNELMYKRPYGPSGRRHTYHLSRKGLDLYPWLIAAWRWERRWADPRGSTVAQLHHQTCNQPTQPILSCAFCGEAIQFADIDIRPPEPSGDGGANDEGAIAEQDYRRRKLVRPRAQDSGHWARVFATVLADRWSGLIVMTTFAEEQRFDDYCRQLGIATNILTDRLDMLTEFGILHSEPYQQGAARLQYRLSEKGEDMYPIFMMLHEWADHWLRKPSSPPGNAFHLSCGHRLRPQMSCSECGDALDARDVSFVQGPAGSGSAIAE